MTAPTERPVDVDEPLRTVGRPARVGRPVAAVDLDQTLIYSARSLAIDASVAFPALVCVEDLDGRPASYMTQRAAQLLVELSSEATVVPVTTRTRVQYARVRLPGPEPAYAVTSNGGYLLVDGTPDPGWSKHVAAGLATGAPLDTVHTHLATVLTEEFTDSLRIADELFCYAVVRRHVLPPGLVEELACWATPRGWVVSLQGRKLYCVPACLRKSAAVAEVVHRVDACAVFAAGDSQLDAELLAYADAAIRPRHGELAETGWAAATVAAATQPGVVSGEQICAWLLERVRSGWPRQRAGKVTAC